VKNILNTNTKLDTNRSLKSKLIQTEVNYTEVIFDQKRLITASIDANVNFNK